MVEKTEGQAGEGQGPQDELETVNRIAYAIERLAGAIERLADVYAQANPVDFGVETPAIAPTDMAGNPIKCR